MKFDFWGVRWHISFWSLVLVTYGIISATSGQYVFLLCILSAVFHEFGHIYFIMKFKGKPSEIVIHPFETQIKCNLNNVSSRQDIIITLAGVSVNLLIAGVSFIVYLLFQFALFQNLSLCNFALVLINLLPVESTDGGQLLNAVLLQFLSERRADVVCSVVSCVFLIPFVLAGVYVLFVSKYNFSVLFIGIYFLIFYINKELR